MHAALSIPLPIHAHSSQIRLMTVQSRSVTAEPFCQTSAIWDLEAQELRYPTPSTHTQHDPRLHVAKMLVKHPGNLRISSFSSGLVLFGTFLFLIPLLVMEVLTWTERRFRPTRHIKTSSEKLVGMLCYSLVSQHKGSNTQYWEWIHNTLSRSYLFTSNQFNKGTFSCKLCWG